MVYQIEYSPLAEEHIREFPARLRRIVSREVDNQLGNQPTLPTTQLKLLHASPGEPALYWELRHDDIRVFYRVDEPSLTVYVVAVGFKVRERYHIGRVYISSAELVAALEQLDDTSLN